jgi:NADH-quinone oxidoreductase subunit L
VHHGEHSFLVPALSLFFIALGAAPAYFLYISGRTNPEGTLAELFEKHPSMRRLHTFFWNRWYIDSTYYKVFVDGTIKLLPRVVRYVEDPLDRVFHTKIPALVLGVSQRGVKPFEDKLDAVFHRFIPSIPSRLAALVKYLQTETGVIGFNMLYVLLFYLFVLLLILWVVI